MKLAVIGATGSCGRQVAAQVLARSIIPPDGELHLIGHAGGAHEMELWGLRADLHDAFADRAPRIEVGTNVAESNADIVVMMAGATITSIASDRSQLASLNQRIFEESAADVARMNVEPIVIVQSNPVELAMDVFSGIVNRHRILGAAAWSDSLRFRREIAADLGVTRPQVDAEMWGQHGDHLVPMWSTIHVRGVEQSRIDDLVGRATQERTLADLPEEIRVARAHALSLIERGDVPASYAFVQAQLPDVRAAIKPFFTHFTAGRTTELATAHAVTDVVGFIGSGIKVAIPAQVLLENDWPGLSGPLAVPVLTDPTGWSQVVPEDISADEQAALSAAATAISALNASTKTA
jgi:malate dehydrogenase